MTFDTMKGITLLQLEMMKEITLFFSTEPTATAVDMAQMLGRAVAAAKKEPV